MIFIFLLKKEEIHKSKIPTTLPPICYSIYINIFVWMWIYLQRKTIIKTNKKSMLLKMRYAVPLYKKRLKRYLVLLLIPNSDDSLIGLFTFNILFIDIMCGVSQLKSYQHKNKQLFWRLSLKFFGYFCFVMELLEPQTHFCYFSQNYLQFLPTTYGILLFMLNQNSVSFVIITNFLQRCMPL